MIKAKVGNKVMIECHSGLGSGGPAAVTKITNETVVTESEGDSIIVKTKKAKVIWCGKRAFDAKSGEALKPPWMYYISNLRRKN